MEAQACMCAQGERSVCMWVPKRVLDVITTDHTTPVLLLIAHTHTHTALYSAHALQNIHM